VNGTNALANQYPWLVGIVLGTSAAPFCGGSIVSPGYVLTAAHCCAAMKMDLNTYRIVAGESDTSVVSGFEVYVQVLQTIPHPSYNNKSQDYDFCLLRLASTLTYSTKIRPACLPTDASAAAACKIGSVATVAGWGTLASGSNVLAKQLQTVNVPLVNCSGDGNAYPTSMISKQMFCAAAPGKDSCQGDSGGNYSIGILQYYACSQYVR